MTKENFATEDLKSKVTDSSAWLRLLFILLFAAIYSVAEMVVVAVVVFQFLCVLFTGKRNDKVLSLGASLSSFAYQVFRYLTYNSDERPFPFADWPSDAALIEQAAVSSSAPKPAAKRSAPRKRAASSTRKKSVEEQKPASGD